MKNLQRINVGCVCADGAGTVCCNLVAVPSVALVPHTHGAKKVRGEVSGAESPGQLWGSCDLDRARAGVVSSTPWGRWDTLLSLSPQILAHTRCHRPRQYQSTTVVKHHG